MKRRAMILTAILLLVSGIAGASGGGWNPVSGQAGMVVAGHPEAAQIGLAVLESGGNAMDAAVAVSLALGVAEPYGSGLGGKIAILYHESATGAVHFVDGMDAAGREFDPEALGAMGSAERAEGVHGIGVPGLVAGLVLAHAQWGSRPWAELVLPSAELAEGGFRVLPGMRVFFERRLGRIRSHPETARIYLPGGELPEAGSRLPNPDLAATLRRISTDGRDGFYRGEVAERIIGEIRAHGGRLTLEDFHAYEARMGSALSIESGGATLYAGGPPTTGGATALLSLKALEGHDWDLEAGFLSAQSVDAWARILRHVYPRIQASIADTGEAVASWEAMLEPQALAELRAAAGLSVERVPAGNGLAEESEPALALADGWTTHFVVADRHGNLASVTQSLSHHFGSGVTAPGTGVVLNNSLKNFSFSDPSGVNYGAPGKRPRSTIAPVIGLRDGHAAFALGLPGGGRIPTTTLAVLVDHLVFGSGLGEAIAAPRVHLLRDWSPDPVSRVLQVESGLPEDLPAGLEKRGWEVREVSDSEFFGGMNALEVLDDGGFAGWADPRRTNFAAGY